MVRSLQLSFFCLILCGTACKKELMPETGKLTPVLDTLSVKGKGVSTPVSGKWQWLGSFHTIGGSSNPSTAGYTERLEFTNDSVMTIYRDNIYYYKFSYLYIKDYVYKNAKFDVTRVNGYVYRTTIKNDTLNMATFDLNDDNSMTYIRIK